MNLAPEYLGLPLKNPLVGGTSPFADSLDSARRVEDVVRAVRIPVAVKISASHAAPAQFALSPEQVGAR